MKIQRGDHNINGLTGGLLFSCIITIVICVSYGEYLASQEKERIINDKESRIFPTVSRFQTQIFDTVSLLEVTSSQPSVMNIPYSDQIETAIHGIAEYMDKEKRDVAKRMLYSRGDLDAVFFTLPNGDMYMVEPYQQQLDVTVSNFAFREWYKGLMATKTSYVGEVYNPIGRDDAAIAIVTPVRTNSGEMVGILGVLIDLDAWTKVFDDTVIRKNESFFILDHNGNVVVDSKNKSFKTVKSYSHLQSFNTENLGSPEVTVEMVNGVKVFVMHMPFQIGSKLWSLLIIEPYDDAFANVNLIRIQYGIIVSAIVGITVLYLTRILRISSRKGLPLLDGIKQIEGGFKPELGTNQVTISKRNLVMVSIASSVVVVFVISFFMFAPSLEPIDNISSSSDKSLKTSFVIQNLKGDTLDTWINWKIQKDEPFHVHVQQSPPLTSHRMNVISNAIFSTETIDIDDSLLHKGLEGSSSTYYKGWTGAIESISAETKFAIPIHFHSTVTETESGDIVIRLSSLKNADGYSGYTKAFVDEENNQILKSTITIYDVENLSDDQLAAIVRHEFGHALGLAHSTAPEDLMAPVITAIPYISPCDVSALTGLYNGNTNSQVVCEK